MTIVPHNDNILCEIVQKDEIEKTTPNGFSFITKAIPIYKVVSVGEKVKMYSPGDNITSLNSGSDVCTDDFEYVIFKEDNITGRIED